MNPSTPSKPRIRETEIKPWAEVLSDGTPVGVRTTTPMDAKAERAFIESLSPEVRRFRFLGQLRHPSSALYRQFDIDCSHEMTLGAFSRVEGKEVLLGLSSYCSTSDGSSCECQLTVLDGWHHKGLGTALLKHLIEVARRRGILCMFAIGSTENTDMADLARALGFTRQIDPQDPAQAMYSLWI